MSLPAGPAVRAGVLSRHWHPLARSWPTPGCRASSRSGWLTGGRLARADDHHEQLVRADQRDRGMARNQRQCRRRCPGCGSVSHRVRDCYERQLLDTTIADREVMICLEARRFRYLYGVPEGTFPRQLSGLPAATRAAPQRSTT
jgi:hypothetical protein